MTAKTQNTQLAQFQEAPQSQGFAERFTQGVIGEVMKIDQSVKFSDQQMKLLKKYFITIDGVLKTAELKRLKTTEKYRDGKEFSWSNVNMNKLSQDVADLSAIGMDCSLKNSVFFIPFNNTALGKYDLTPMFGYAGMETKARNFAVEFPKNIIFKLVYSNDTFQEIVKDRDNQINTVIHQIVDSFNRGDIVGGYWWKIFEDETKNEVKVLTLRDIEKRIPKNASVEFWGGEKAVWKGGQKTSEVEEVEGWFEEMCIKTIKRHCYDSFILSSEKMNEFATRFLALEATANRIEFSENEEETLKEEIAKNANKKPIDFDPSEIMESNRLNEAQPSNMPAQPQAPAEPITPLFNEQGNANENQAETPNF